MNVSDLELGFLEKHLSLIDAQLDRVVADGKGCGDPDAFGVLDDIESLAGLGFVACQRYLTATYGWMRLTKQAALTVGPKHHSGFTVVEVVNHAANFWKHHDEWNPGKKTKQQERTEEALVSLGALPSDYPVTRVLTEIAGGYLFKSLMRDMASWSKELHAPPKASGGEQLGNNWGTIVGNNWGHV
jgi:hypothetical protein